MDINLSKLPPWLQTLVSNFGGVGIFVIGFLDSSILSFPVINDLLIVTLSVRTPAAMPYYVAMATLGSLAGSVWLYFLAKKGGEAYFRRYAGERAARIRSWIQRKAFLSVAIPSILPPPMPFKLFVLASGIFQVRLRTFVLALLAGRGLRYLAEGILAVRYGQDAFRMIREHTLAATFILLGLIGLSVLITRLVFRGDASPTSDAPPAPK